MWYLTRFFSNFALRGAFFDLPQYEFPLLSSLLKYRPFDRNNLLINLIFSFTISGIITSINVYTNGFEHSFWQILIEYAINSIYVFLGFSLLSYPIVGIIKYLNKKLPWSSNWFTRVLVTICLIIAISIVTALVFAIISTQSIAAEEGMLGLLVKYFAFSFIACMTFFMLIEAIVFFNEREAIVKKNEKLIQENLAAKFEVLKNQINPHFLFNNLNVLSSLVYKDPKQADRFILEFSNIYRYILEMQSETTVTLEKEISFLNSYIFLLKQRFKDSLQVKINLSADSLAMSLPPLTMQLLMENVMKHNSLTPENPIEVNIIDEDGAISFTNNIIPRQQIPESSGIGLSNIMERYKLLSDRMPIYADQNGYFKVAIPLLN